MHSHLVSWLCSHVHAPWQALVLSLLLGLIPRLGDGSLHLVISFVIHLLHQLHQTLAGVFFVIRSQIRFTPAVDSYINAVSDIPPPPKVDVPGLWIIQKGSGFPIFEGRYRWDYTHTFNNKDTPKESISYHVGFDGTVWKKGGGGIISMTAEQSKLEWPIKILLY